MSSIQAVLTGELNKSLVSVDANTGAIQWSLSVKNMNYEPPVWHDGKIFVSGGESLLCCEDKAGNILWDSKQSERLVGQPLVMPEYERIIVQGKKHLFGMDLKTGQVKWQIPCERYANTSCTAVKDIVYAGSDNGEIIAVRATGGTIFWRQNMNQLKEAAGAKTCMYSKKQDGSTIIRTITETGFVENHFKSDVTFKTDEESTDEKTSVKFQKVIGAMGQPMIDGNMLYVTCCGGWCLAFQLDNVN